MARSQDCAERSAETLTIVDGLNASPVAHLAHMDRWRSEPAWRSRFREVLVWATLTSWLISLGSIETSFIFTGNFLFETHATANASGYVTNYFKVAALAFLLPLAWSTVGMAVLGITRRTAR